MSAPTMASFNTARNRWAVRAANLALKCASSDYRSFIKMTLLYGLRSAARDIDRDLPPPPPIVAGEDSVEVPMPTMGRGAA